MLVGNILATAAIRFRDAAAVYCSSTNQRFSFRKIDDRANTAIVVSGAMSYGKLRWSLHSIKKGAALHAFST
jgi:hypothetical protein